MNLKPIGDNVLIEKDPPKPLTVGGILIPECLERTPRYCPNVLGTVLSVGPRVTVLKPGMRIWLKDVAGDDYEVFGKKLTLLRERHITGMDETQMPVEALETALAGHPA